MRPACADIMKKNTFYYPLLFVALIWGGNFVFSKIALSGIRPFTLVSFRNILTAFAFFSLWKYRGGRIIKPGKDLLYVFGLGILGIILNQLFFLIGLDMTTPSHSAIILALIPVMIMFMEKIREKTRITPREALGSAVAFTGVVILVAGRGISISSEHLAGDAITFIGGFIFAAFTYLGKPMVMKYGPLAVTAYASIMSTILLAPLFLIDIKKINTADITMPVVLSFIYMVVFAAVLAYYWYYKALEKMPASSSSTVIYFEPVIAAVLSVALLNETMYWNVIAGGIAVMGGLVVIHR